MNPQKEGFTLQSLDRNPPIELFFSTLLVPRGERDRCAQSWAVKHQPPPCRWTCQLFLFSSLVNGTKPKAPWRYTLGGREEREREGERYNYSVERKSHTHLFRIERYTCEHTPGEPSRHTAPVSFVLFSLIMEKLVIALVGIPAAGRPAGWLYAGDG